ncbi:SMP-30/gluconolactonase/LRE family protein [Oceanicoccus sagamiensis]|uniref:SMP-30/Gluconolactonase/LRE-like region domain-containing protein n=1 Tax=Oceanicoccus sagamiensis TaxID=716816 RepID=A0A1X9NIZ9_9GAMM|nr:SMP-30/gluconolactonase/LRE family protein [Oceanicoccus sagamiensis]ARN75815.1 hypothetical protein BST96_17895 [Oceanicoccus sagamiensis]
MKKILLSLLLIVVLFSLWSYNAMDGFDTVEPHFAGSCEVVRGEGSAEDIEIDHQAGVAFISAKDRLGAASSGDNNGTITVYDLAAAKDRFEMEPLQGMDDFSPHGISLYQAEDGRRRLYVINHRATGEETIEVFDVAADHSLNFVKTLRDPLFFSPNDLVAVGWDQLYIANDSGATNGFETGMQMMGLMDISTIVYFDQDRATVAIDSFPTSGGINSSKDGKTLYIGGTSSKSLEVYRRDVNNGALSFLQSFDLKMGVDNIDVAVDGAVWVAGHPKVIDLIGHFASQGEKPAPSQVYILPLDTMANDGSLAAPVDIFTSLGDDLSASSVAAEHQGKFYIGGITPKKMLVCTPG